VPWENQNQLRKGIKRRIYYRESKGSHRFFHWQMASDQMISIALMAYHYGASIRGTQITCKSVLGKKPCTGTLIRWKRKFANQVCHVCIHLKTLGNIRMCEGRIIPDVLEGICGRFTPKLVRFEVLEKAKEFFASTKMWRPYSIVGHPGKSAKYDQREWERRYRKKYYRTHPEYARKLLKHPEKLYSRIKIWSLTEEEQKERKRKRQREWARKKYRKEHPIINEEMSRRGTRGAEVKWGRKYN